MGGCGGSVGVDIGGYGVTVGSGGIVGAMRKQVVVRGIEGMMGAVGGSGGIWGYRKLRGTIEGE